MFVGAQGHPKLSGSLVQMDSFFVRSAPACKGCAISFALLLLTLSGCVAAKSPVVSDPPFGIEISLNLSSVTVQTSAKQKFNATIKNTSNTGVTWQINGFIGGDSAHGTVTADGMFTAPASVPSPATVTITAIAQADTSKTASAQVTIIATPAITVAVSPSTASIQTGQTQNFTATLQNETQNMGVKWSLNGAGCTGTACGKVSAASSTSGVAITYTAPATLPSPATVTLTATSVADNIKTGTATITVTAAPVIIVAIAPTSASVQAGIGKQNFTAMLQNDSQNKGVSWSLSGAGCSGATCGSLVNATTTSVTYTAPAAVPSPATVTLMASSVADNTRSAAAAITVTSTVDNISVSLTPKRGGLTTGQSLLFTATVANDAGNAGVMWSLSAGSFSVQNTTFATFVAPNAGGTVTVTATSIADVTKNASATMGVTDLAGVFMHHNNVSRDGANTKEYALTPSTVSTSTFGKLFSCSVDAAVYAQPLWVANLSFSGVKHNVVYVATQHNTVYALDADSASCQNLWGGPKSLNPSNETWVSFNDESGCTDLMPDIGIVGTPVIDPVSNTIYLVTKTKNNSDSSFHQRLHALDLITGNENLNPTEIQATVTGTGTGSSNGKLSFDPLLNNQRPALLLVDGHVIVTWASHCDFGPYHGWVMSYNAGTLGKEAVLNTSPNGGADSGIWMSGSGPAADGSGNIFLATGNGSWDGSVNFGDSIMKLASPSAGTFSVSDYFTPIDQDNLSNSDEDLGSGGVLLLPDRATGAQKHLLVQVGKQGKIYLVNRDQMGHILCTAASSSCTGADTQIVQELPGAINGMWGAPASWNGNVYFSGAQAEGSGDLMFSYSFDAGGSGLLSTQPISNSTHTFTFASPTPSVSATGASNGIVWGIDSSSFGSSCCQVLYSYDALDLKNLLFTSEQASSNRDQAGGAVKFTVPTVANGKVYLGGQSTLTVFGLLPN
jgi:hypothetical protein